MTERAFQRKVLRRLRLLGGVWVNKSPSPWDPTGIADILGTSPGVCGIFVAIELKQPGAYSDPRLGLSEPQKRFLKKVHDAGGIAICADAWETVDNCLAKLSGNVYPDTRPVVAQAT